MAATPFCKSTDAPLTRADIMSLIQASAPTAGGSKPAAGKNGTCHKCGKSGHWKKDCPDLKKESKTPSASTPSTNSKKGGGKFPSWKNSPPAPGDAEAKKYKGKNFYWCARCNRWSTTHGTVQHRGKDDVAAPTMNYLVPDPSAWLCQLDSSWSTLWGLGDLGLFFAFILGVAASCFLSSTGLLACFGSMMVQVGTFLWMHPA